MARAGANHPGLKARAVQGVRVFYLIPGTGASLGYNPAPCAVS